MNHIVSGNCMDGAKKGGFCYTNRNFYQEDNREEERWWLQCSGAPIIVRVDHLQHEYHDTPKFGSALLSSAVWPKFCVTLYGPPPNVETLQFCWCSYTVLCLHCYTNSAWFCSFEAQCRYIGFIITQIHVMSVLYFVLTVNFFRALQLCTLIGCLLMRAILKEQGVSPEDIKFSTTMVGKPYIMRRNIYFQQ